MVEKTEVKMDDLGRIVIPKKVRKKFSIGRNEYLTLETDDEKIILKKKIVLDKYKDIIKKLDFLNKHYNLSLIMMDNNEIIYTTENYKKLLHKKIAKDLVIKEKLNYCKETLISKIDFLIEPHYYFSIKIDACTNGALFIIDNNGNSNEVINLIYNLLK